MPNALVDLYRKKLAEQGQSDDRPDYFITQELGQLAQAQAPELFTTFPDFGKEYGDIREASAPSLPGEFGRAVKSGTQALFSDLDSAAALAARGLGLDKISEFYKGRAQELGNLAAEEPPTVPTVKDIAPGETGVGRVFSKDTARYLAAKAGGAVPSLAEITGLGLAGAATGGTALAGEAAALGLGAFPLSAGAIYKETGRPDLAVGLGAVGALAGAAPVIGLPARVIRSLFPDLSGAAAAAAAKELVGSKTSELLAKLGRAGITEATGTAGMLGMEAANIVAKNIATGKDALTLEPDDWNRLREAAIGGALATVPFAAISARGGGKGAPAPEVDPAATQIPPVSTAPIETPIGERPPPPSAPLGAADIYRTIRAMTPEQQRARLEELSADVRRTPEQEQEFALLSALVPPVEPAPAPQPPGVVETGITPPVSESKVAAGPTVPPSVPDETTVPPDETTITTTPPENKVAPAVFVGMQQGEPGRIPDFELFNLTENIPGHPKGSTVSRQTLEEAGFTVPERLAPEVVPPKPPKEEAVRPTEIAPVTFKDVGFETEGEFKTNYAERHVKEVFETESEFIRRIFCSSR